MDNHTDAVASDNFITSERVDQVLGEEYAIKAQDVHEELSQAIMPIAMASMKGLCHPNYSLLSVLQRSLNVIVQYEAQERENTQLREAVLDLREALKWLSLVTPLIIGGDRTELDEAEEFAENILIKTKHLAQEAVNTNDTAREAFEKRYAVLDLTRSYDDPFQDYKSGGTDILWNVWQASRATLPKVTEAELVELIDKTIEEHDDDIERNLDSYGESVARAILAKFPFLRGE